MKEYLFVPYEEAIQLKELGFEEPCFGYYVPLLDDTQELEIKLIETNGNRIIIAPTFSQAFRFFREKYNLHSYIEGAYPWFRYYINSEDDRWEGFKHTLFEEAELELLKKLIEIAKKEKQ